ncbi:MAG: dTDP-4-dehydrorhamnose 3,5-epimerase [Chloroflexales bacterium]|nr:dTDP-4-dehydrorhamnose 3,5-epimerase [Chloroflexales bacterium]
MIFTETPLAGAFLVEPERIADERGFFARTWCAEEFAARGLEARLVQCNVSYNQRRGTLRGMHYQAEPHAEVKLVRCTAGAIHDVIIDLRPASPTRHQWFAAELSAANRLSLYIPAGFAHGFQTLEDQSEVFYQMAEFYHSESARGVRYNDPAFGIAWPLPISVIGQRDAAYPLLEQP